MKYWFKTGLLFAANLLNISSDTMLADAKKSDDGKCRILSFRGGGVHGAYEVGALRAILEGMPSDEVMYDYVGGVSVGALNAAIFATTEPGKEQEAVD